MKLLIVESPAKAKTISKYLDNKYTVKASVGHVRDLPKSNKKAIDIEGGFVPHYEVSPGKAAVLDEITELAGKAEEVLLATDPDREGEAIAWHIAEAAKLKKPRRVVFHEITKEAVTEAILHPRPIDQNLRRAQEARRVLDRLVGYDLSGLIWKKLRYGLSAGRVQSPALRILVEREREIRAFIPEQYFVIHGNFKTKSGEEVELTCEEEPRTKAEADRIVSVGEKEKWSVLDVKETETSRSPRPPFITSTLQQAASSRLGFAPSRTMGIAQKLYEAGLITYMRTDSPNISATAIPQIVSTIEKRYGKEFVEMRTYASRSKNAQEAHEAIRPTSFANEKAGHNPEQQKLYKLIWDRTVASQMADAKIMKTKVSANVESGTIPNFSVVGSRVIFPGWLKADTDAIGEETTVPKVVANDPLTLLSLISDEKFTTPPNRYSEAGLVKELEKRGIGRPSTYASIIKTLYDRGYVDQESRSLRPTDTGEAVSSFLEEHFGNYISDTFTAEMEESLDDIADGKKEYEKTLKAFYTPFHKDVKSKEKVEKITNLGDAPKEFLCPKCSGGMIFKLSRGGKFMSCARFPDCDGARTEDGREITPNAPIGTDPESGKSIFVLEGRFGPFVQIGETPKGKGSKSKDKPRRASIPKEKDPLSVTMVDAMKYLSLPRELGIHPETGKIISANIGRFGPYIVHDGDFRSLKTDDVYAISLPRALEILKEEKKKRGFARKKK